MQEMIEAAKKRTAELLAQAANPQPVTETLPASLKVQKEEKPLVSMFKSTMVTINGVTFDPYEIEGVGRLNEEQSMAVKLFGLEGASGCLIGPAGTGKTTTMKAIIRAMVLSGRIPILPQTMTHKYIKAGLPGIYLGSFTRIATRNLKDNTPDDIKPNVHTIHRLLEYEPTFEDVVDPEGNEKTIKVFKPKRTESYPLPADLKAFGLDEASMLGTRLHANLEAAIGCNKPQMLYIGDIAQLPPVMDDSIFGYKLLELPVVELKHVYRHAGVIVHLANYIRIGNTIPDAKKVVPYMMNLRKMPRKMVEEGISEWNREEDGSKVTIHLWKSRLEGEVGQLRALQNLNGFFQREIKEGRYDPMKHMILIPYNKAVGTLELNKYISEFLGKQRNAEVHEVIAGYNKCYFAEGDKVFYDREEAIIIKINKNAMYSGKLPQASSVTLDRWGHNKAGEAQIVSDEDVFSNLDAILNVDIGDDEERKNQASHVIYLKKLSDGDDETTEHRIDTAAEVNSLLGGYALTIHKSQGSQWQKVYCVFHNSHNRNLQRELLYTAITRAQKELYVIAEPETFIQGVLSQHILGNTIEEKAQYFKGKQDAQKKRDELFNS